MLVFYRNAERIKFGHLQKYRHFRLCPTFCKPLENFATQSIGAISVLSVGEIILFEHSSDFIKKYSFYNSQLFVNKSILSVRKSSLWQNFTLQRHNNQLLLTLKIYQKLQNNANCIY